jgi:MATE family multidrug resistance protein
LPVWRERVYEQAGSVKSYLDIIKLVWPLALGMVNNALMQFVDRAFLARESMASLEAIMPSSMLSLILLSFFQAIVAYSGTFVATYYGAKNDRMCQASCTAGIILSFIFGAVSLLFIPLGESVFEAFSHGEDVISRQKTYFSITVAGGIFLYGQMAVQSYFTGRGKTQTVFLVNLAGNLLNIVLDPIFIFGLCGLPKMGIAGAAYATVGSLMLQWLSLWLILKREERLRNDKSFSNDKVKWFSAEMLRLSLRIVRFGALSGLYNVLNLLSFTIFVFFTGAVGHLEVAVSNACFAVNYLLFAPIEGFALGAATLVGQAKGAGDFHLARKSGWRCALLAVATTAVLLALTLMFYRPILSIFAPDDPILSGKFIELGFTLLVLMAAWQVFEVFDTVISGALKGAGDTSFVLWWMLVVAFLFWMPLVVFVSKSANSMPNLWSTMIAYVAVLSAGTLFRWRSGGWLRINIV